MSLSPALRARAVSDLTLIPVAALFVAEDGPYVGLRNVDLWGVSRDARTYDGSDPVVAHPPCERWGRYWSGGPNPKAVRRELGDDGGCFAAALRAVRTCGGVLEHPCGSRAWEVFGLGRPPAAGGWVEVPGDLFGGWTCKVEQGRYGHAARKPTWLYYVGGLGPLQLLWGSAPGRLRLDDGFHSKAEADAARADPSWRPLERLSRNQRIFTPTRFRDRLLQLARWSAFGKTGGLT